MEKLQEHVVLQTASNQLSFRYGNLSYLAAVCAEKGVRRKMEDEHLMCSSIKDLYPALPIERDAAILLICDGHGGRTSATFVKTHMVEELAHEIIDLPQNVEVPFKDKEIYKVITNACHKLDTRLSEEIPHCKDGCTAILVFIQNEIVWTATIGDSAAFLCITVDGTVHAVPLSETHKPWMVLEKQRIVKCKGTVENGRVNGTLQVSRSFGDLNLKRFGVISTPTLSKFNVDIDQSPFIIIGCDGFWSSWSEVEALTKAKDLITKEFRRTSILGCDPPYFDLKRICKQLVEHALLDKRSQDNISIIAVQIANT